MAYAVVQDIASTWEQYEHYAVALGEGTPVGLILHVAGPTDEGFRIIAIWESEQAWWAFHAERLAPAIAALGGPGRPEPTFRGLRSAHVVADHRMPIAAAGLDDAKQQEATKEGRR